MDEKLPLLARYDRDTGRKQLLKNHGEAVAKLCSKKCSAVGLSKTGFLLGLLHDGGKSILAYIKYLLFGDYSQRGSINHSSFGARFIVEELSDTCDKTIEGITASLLAGAICAHHSGPFDYVSPTGEDVLKRRVFPEKDTQYEEAKELFLSECCEKEQLVDLFTQAVDEVDALVGHIASYFKGVDEKKGSAGKLEGQTYFFFGMLERYLLSALVDSDRLDAFNFSIEGKYKEPQAILWSDCAHRVKSYLNNFSQEKEIDKARKAVSDLCLDFAKHGPGVYRLAAPTGSGKTLAVLPMAIAMAENNISSRIIYCAPFKVIVNQTAAEWSEALGDSSMILEHHSDVVFTRPEGEAGRQKTEEDKLRYELLTQRWSSPFIVTTTVQFLQTLFSGKTASLRRFQAFAHSIIILDEVQAVPLKFTSMLNAALNFLAEICGCTIILCTATPPALSIVPVALGLSALSEIIPQEIIALPCFKRVHVEDKTERTFSTNELAEFVMEQQRLSGSILVILNTKKAVRRLFEEMSSCFDVPVYYLSTSLCSAHRTDRIDEIKQKLLDSQPVICLSTSLIEAGIDISFSCVVRSLAGLDSIAQAAGRCNRHYDPPEPRNVFVVQVDDENLGKLPEIEQGRQAAKTVLWEFRKSPEKFDNDLISPAAVQRYYQVLYKNASKDDLDYFVKKEDDPRLYADTTLYDLLSKNNSARSALLGKNDVMPKERLCQAFGTAGSLMKPIDNGGAAAVVPYREGVEIIEKLHQASFADLPDILRQAQRYTVTLFEYEKEKLIVEGGLHFDGNSGALILDKRFYRECEGVCFGPSEMDLLIVE